MYRIYLFFDTARESLLLPFRSVRACRQALVRTDKLGNSNMWALFIKRLRRKYVDVFSRKKVPLGILHILILVDVLDIQSMIGKIPE